MSPAGTRVPIEVAVRGKTYVGADGRPHEALRGVSFALAAGQVGALIGPSGCGKTTLLRIVAGLDGRFDGTLALPASGHPALVFQEPRLLPWRNVWDNVCLAAPDAGEGEIAALFAALGFGAHRGHYPGELSLGLARRAAIVRALAARPNLLLLDEPFASLDAATTERLVKELTDIIARERTTTLLVTHDVDLAIRLADVVFVLSEGPVRLLGAVPISTPRGGLSQPAIAQAHERIAALQGTMKSAR